MMPDLQGNTIMQNILALPGRQIDVDEAKNCFKIFINTSFDGGKHQKRVEKID